MTSPPEGPSPEIIFPPSCVKTMIDHCRRKLSGNYLEGEDRDLKAFGLVAGNRKEGIIEVGCCLPLLKNARSSGKYQRQMNQMMADHAVPSITPLDKRGWVADPEELAEKLRLCRRQDQTLIGTYHMHRVAWEHDQVRDTPTELDTVLGRESRLIMFIISMVRQDRPIIRAFNEGIPEGEIPIKFHSAP